MRFALALCGVLAIAACGDNSKAAPDAPGMLPDGTPDAPVVNATLTTYVIDLITNQTSDMTSPKAFTEFSTLPDPDGDANNLNAYKTLFP